MHLPVLDPNLVLWATIVSDVASTAVSVVSLVYILKVHNIIKVPGFLKKL